MTVAELIAELQKLPADAPVKVWVKNCDDSAYLWPPLVNVVAGVVVLGQ